MTLPQAMPCQPQDDAFDAFLARALTVDGAASWPADWSDEMTTAAFATRLLYHGVPGLLASRPETVAGWPAPVLAHLREQSLVQSVWELHHKPLVGSLLDVFAAAGIAVVLLKGTALAYDLYPDPATRIRGDTDVLIAPGDLVHARNLLESRGFTRESGTEGLFGNLHSQEIWKHTTDHGEEHVVDLHWQVLNSPFLKAIMPRDACIRGARALPTLGPHARAMSRSWMLFHACIHRAVHISNPYFVDGRAYLGGDRLIWLYDIKLMARACSAEDWGELVRIAHDAQVSALCREALVAARDGLGAILPDTVDMALAHGHTAPAIVHYLTRASQFDRAWRDLRASHGLAAKSRYALAQLLPAREIVRKRFGGAADTPLALLYARRLGEIIARKSAP